jgi:geranylgeranyl pyrophosphate synthase
MIRCSRKLLRKEPEVTQRVLYAIGDIGLRLRPFLVRIGAEIGGLRDSEKVISVATAVEFLQISTLVVDDILDSSKKRNGVESVSCKWGVREAILVGEVLRSLSNQVLLGTRGVEKKRLLEINLLHEAIYLTICSGQLEDLRSEKSTLRREREYFAMTAKTTASFIQSSLKAGGLLSGLDTVQLRVLADYGILLGLAYQLRDDIINLVGDEEFTGKEFAEDIRTHKMRLPIVHALNVCNPVQRRALVSAWRKPRITKDDTKRILGILKQCGAIAYCMKRTKQLCDRASAKLEPLKPSEPKQFLLDLAHLISDFSNQSA